VPLVPVWIREREQGDEQHGRGDQDAADREAARPRAIGEVQGTDREEREAVRDQEEPDQQERPDRAPPDPRTPAPTRAYVLASVHVQVRARSAKTARGR
jgi:hypothetical protein